jgi:hypothetical protein
MLLSRQPNVVSGHYVVKKFKVWYGQAAFTQY